MTITTKATSHEPTSATRAAYDAIVGIDRANQMRDAEAHNARARSIAHFEAVCAAEGVVAAQNGYYDIYTMHRDDAEAQREQGA